ncbi:MAG: deoxynucleoside kinase [Bacteroidota bacterium]
MRYDFITIEGNIGAGKTTLASRLAQAYKARLILEEFEHNPFLPKFYSDPDRYAFKLELSFLCDRFEQLCSEFAREPQTRISDYYFNKTLIFARANLSSQEFMVFEKLFRVMSERLPRPGLIIFLRPATQRLKDNIARRGRQYEQDIRTEYLERIQQAYSSYLQGQKEVPVLQLDLVSSNYVNSLDDFSFLDRLLNLSYPPGLTQVEI